jgi:hypothetical protein
MEHSLHLHSSSILCRMCTCFLRSHNTHNPLWLWDYILDSQNIIQQEEELWQQRYTFCWCFEWSVTNCLLAQMKTVVRSLYK